MHPPHETVASCREHSSSSGDVDVSIIIVSWNAKEYLRLCLTSIRSIRNIRCETIIVDNDSRDGSPEMVEAEFPEMFLSRCGSNLGFAKANNIGIALSRGRYVALVNSDVVLMDNCMHILVEYLDRNCRTGLAGPQILNADLSVQGSCYGRPTFANSLSHAVNVDKLLAKWPMTASGFYKYQPYSSTGQVDVLSGCFWVARREALSAVGLLDESFFFAWEDFDWCRRFWKTGWEVSYVVEASAIHYGQASSANAPSRFAIEVERSHFRYWQKHFPPSAEWTLAGMIFLRHALQLIKATALFCLFPRRRASVRTKLQKNSSVIKWLVSGAYRRSLERPC